MKYCPTCQRRFPDLISMCPTDQSVLTDTPPIAGEPKAAAAPAPAKEKESIDTRTLEEKLFAPLPKRTADAAPAAPPAAQKAVAPPPAPKPAPGSTTKVMETVFEDPAPQKSSKLAAVAGGQEIPWNKIIPAALAVVVIFAALVIFRKNSAPPAAAAPEAGSSIDPKDVDMEINVRDAFSQSAALRNQDIKVRVKDGTVILTGEASSAAKIEQAVRAAKALPGVTQVVNRLQINPSVGTRTEGHSYSAGGLQPAVTGDTNGLAEQAKAHQLVLAGDRAAAHGDYKSAASFYKQALTLNPDDTAASVGYTQAMEKLQ